jgi:histidinol-phosphatase (PHP family)
MADMARAAHANGIRAMCFTDHVDLDDWRTGRPDLHCFDNLPEMRRQYAAALAEKPADMALLLGVELGEANHDPARAAAIAGTEGFDFIIGSLHNLRGQPDFYELRYASMDACRACFDSYLTELIELAGLDCFDVMAHIGYPRRYMRRDGFDTKLTLAEHGDALSALFRTLIQSGRGIEVNCSSLRSEPWEAIPDLPLLQLYRALGGEIVTVGSDAHFAADAGVGCAKGHALLREAGFRYVTVFRQRKPEFIKIQEV